MPAQDVLLALESSQTGLGTEEAKRRLKESGYNRLHKEKPTSVLKIFLRQLESPLMLILVIAVTLSLVLGKYADSILTLGVIAINVLMGFIQEYRADRALRALKTFLPTTAMVRRNGKVLSIDAEEIVKGDILLLEAGSKVTADGRLLKAFNLATSEAALTGESSEVEKSVQAVETDAVVADRASCVYAGTIVTAGRAEVVVTETGKTTEFGKVTDMVVAATDDRTPLQVELLRLSRALVGILLAAAIGVFLLGVFRGMSLVEMLSTSAALAVAAVPEGLIVSVTVILTVGMRRMLKRKALVHRLVAAETLGGVSILCVDKTGTVTTGEMTVTEFRVGTVLTDSDRPSEAAKSLLADFFVVNSARVEERKGEAPLVTGSLTETAVMRYLLARKDKFSREMQVMNEIPFDSERKFSAKLVRSAGRERAVVMGAPDVLLGLADLNDQELRSYHAALENMTARGLRVLLLAEKPLNQAEFTVEHLTDLKPLGLLGLSDPLRPEAQTALKQAAEAGVHVIMITGDHPRTAEAIARELGLVIGPENIVIGSDLAKMSDEELSSRVKQVNVFARIQPEQKLRIVKSLQTLGFSVAMTGDGVNDAPALRAADIGVAVGSGTAVAKEAADMVILDNNIGSIVAAIREGRIIFDNIRKVLMYLLTFSLSEVVLIMVILILGYPVPFAPLHFLWINLVTDGLPSVALAFEPGEAGIMSEPPRRRNEPIVTGGMRRLMFFVGLVAVGGLLALYAGLYVSDYAMESLRAMLFLALGLDSLLAIFPLRSLRQPLWKLSAFKNPQLLVAVASGLALLLLPYFIPPLAEIFGFGTLLPFEVGLVVAICLVKVLLIEVGKSWFLRDVRKPRLALLS